MTTAPLPAGIVLGAAVWPDGPSPTLVRRSLHAARLYQSGVVDRLVLCGGLGENPPTEAAAMARILRDQNVPDSAMILEETSTTTGENLRHAVRLMEHPPREIVIITDWYHTPRACLVARRLGLRAVGSSPSLKGARLWPQIKGALREIPAYLAYWAGLKS